MDEAQLIERAQESLAEIFDAPVRLQLDATESAPPFDIVQPPFDIVQEVAIRSGEASLGRILMGQRASEAPYFSEDMALVTSLADVLASVIENLRLQRREQEQDHARVS